MIGNEHCVKDCEKQGPCESCTEWKGENKIIEPKFYSIVCQNCGNDGFAEKDGKPTCKSCGYVLTEQDIDAIMDEATEEFFKK